MAQFSLIGQASGHFAKLKLTCSQGRVSLVRSDNLANDDFVAFFGNLYFSAVFVQVRLVRESPKNPFELEITGQHSESRKLFAFIILCNSVSISLCDFFPRSIIRLEIVGSTGSELTFRDFFVDFCDFTEVKDIAT